MTSAPLLHRSSVDACDILVKALHDGGGLNAAAHKACVREARNQARKARLKEEETYLNGLKLSGGRKMAKRLDRMGKTGAWLSAIPNRFDGTELSREEFQDNLARHSLRPAPQGPSGTLRWMQRTLFAGAWAQLQKGGLCGTAA